MQVPSKLKNVLKTHLETAEMKLHDQQRRLAHQRRVSRAQDSLMSEDQKKMRKKKLKVCSRECTATGTVRPRTLCSAHCRSS